MEGLVHDVAGVSLYSEDVGKPLEHLISEIMQSDAFLEKLLWQQCEG